MRNAGHRPNLILALSLATAACAGVIVARSFAQGDINPPQYAHGAAVSTPTDHIALATQYVLPASFHLRAEFPDGRQVRGTGFIVEGDGKALTYAPLVAGASRVRVRMSDGTWRDAQLEFADTSTGIAGLMVKGTPGVNLLNAPLGFTEETVMGESVATLSLPSGVLPVISVGRLAGSGQILSERSNRTTFAMTDAMISPATAGGPVVAADGRVIGICTDADAIFVPITTARRLIDVWRDRGSVAYSTMGLTLAPVRDFARGVEAEGNFGGVLATVAPKSPADDAGLLAGDRLLEIDGIPINVLEDEVMPQIQLMFDLFPADKPLQVRVRRGEEIITSEVVPMAAPSLK